MPNIVDKLEQKHTQALRSLPSEFMEYLDYMEYKDMKLSTRAKGEERAEMAGRLLTWDELRQDILKAKK